MGLILVVLAFVSFFVGYDKESIPFVGLSFALMIIASTIAPLEVSYINSYVNNVVEQNSDRIVYQEVDTSITNEMSQQTNKNSLSLTEVFMNLKEGAIQTTSLLYDWSRYVYIAYLVWLFYRKE